MANAVAMAKLRIREILKKKGLSQIWLADRLSAHPVTISNKLKPQNVDKLDIEWLTRIADALDVPLESLFVAPVPGRIVPVVGEVQAGEWAESWQWPEDDWQSVPVRDQPGLASVRLFGVVTRGPSMNRRYPEGTVLVVADIVDTGEDLKPGKRYVVERERADGFREATVKTLWLDETGKAWLLPESNDPRYQSPIAVDGTDGETIRIIGRVVRAVMEE
jgi:SOS-response transcriptional repressor LexA